MGMGRILIIQEKGDGNVAIWQHSHMMKCVLEQEQVRIVVICYVMVDGG